MNNIFDNVKLYFLTKKAQKYILEKVKYFKNINYENVKTVLKTVTNNILLEVPNIYSSFDYVNRMIDFFGKRSLKLPVVLHENLHVASGHIPYPYGEEDNFEIGFSSAKNICVRTNSLFSYIFYGIGIAINEGFTEYFAKQILLKNNEKPIYGPYDDLVEIVLKLCLNVSAKGNTYVDCYFENQIFANYINGNLNGLKDLFVERYKTNRELIDILILKMDELNENNISSVNENYYNELLVQICEILLQIRYDEFKAKVGITKEEFLQARVGKIMKKSSLINEDTYESIYKIAEKRFLTKNYESKFDSSKVANVLSKIIFIKTGINEKKFAIKYIAEQKLKESIICENNYIDELKNLSDMEKLFVITQMPIILNQNEIKGSKLLSSIISDIVKYAIPKDFDLKNKAMFELLHSKFYRDNCTYQNFSQSQIRDYLNNDLERAEANKNLLKNDNVIKGIYNNIVEL